MNSASDGIVSIFNNNNLCGTGFYFTKDGYILTCYHVIENIDDINTAEITIKDSNNNKYKAKLIEQFDDVAILKTNHDTHFFYYLSPFFQCGSDYDTYGFPYDLKQRLAACVQLIDVLNNRMQLDRANAITAGFSGAPLLNSDLSLGIINEYIADENVIRNITTAFAIPSKVIFDESNTYGEKLPEIFQSFYDEILLELFEFKDRTAISKYNSYIIKEKQHLLNNLNAIEIPIEKKTAFVCSGILIYIKSKNIFKHLFSHFLSECFFYEKNPNFVTNEFSNCIAFFKNYGYNLSPCEMAVVEDYFVCVVNAFTNWMENPNVRRIVLFFLNQNSTTIYPHTSIGYKDYNSLLNKYTSKLFWDRNDAINLQQLFIPNQYKIDNDETCYNDLEEVIKSYINNSLRTFLSQKRREKFDYRVLIISSPIGCGKTSLISKIAFEYNCMYNGHFLIYILATEIEEFSVNSILKKIKIETKGLSNCILIIDGIDEIMGFSESLLEIFIENILCLNCRAIITCRDSGINFYEFMSCIEIKLNPFNKSSAIEWIKKYGKIEAAFETERWCKAVENLPENLENIVLNPLVLYMCIHKIDVEDVSKINGIGQLYDILFDQRNGEAVLPPYKTSHISMANWKIMRGYVSRCSASIFNGTNYKLPLEQSGLEYYKSLFGLVFKNQTIVFAHSSIWQYFFAELIFNIVQNFLFEGNVEEYWEQIRLIISNESSKKINRNISGFFVYFLESKSRNIITKEINDILSYVLINLNTWKDYKYLWEIHFDITSLIWKTKFPENMSTFFNNKCGVLNNLISCTKQLKHSFLSNLQYYKFTNNFSNINLSYANLISAQIHNSFFRNADFSHSNLKACYGYLSNYEGSDFSSAILKVADLSASKLRCCDFQNANFDGAILTNAILDGSDLRGITFAKAKFTNASLKYCLINCEQIGQFKISTVLNQKMIVFNQGVSMSTEQIKEYFKKVDPVSYGFWEAGLSNEITWLN